MTFLGLILSPTYILITDFSKSYILSADDWFHILFRLCLSLLVGSIIGLERQLRHKPAGLRTHAMVSLGSALFVIIPLALNNTPSYDSVSRVIQGIAAGVGFLGTGEILRQNSQDLAGVEIYGLTSAAAIWVSSALGIAAGCGLWQISLMGALLAYLILHIVYNLEHHRKH